MSTLSIPFLSSRPIRHTQGKVPLWRSSFPGLLRVLAMTLGAILLLISAKTAEASVLHKAPNNLGLVGYWSFEDGVGLKATDFSGNGNTGTLINGPVWTAAGKIGKALNFTAASGQYVAMADSNSLDVTTAFTISAWTNGTTYVAKNDPDTTGAYIFYVQVGTVPILTIRGIEAITDTGSNCGTAGRWAHFTVVHVGTNYAFYCNGALNSNVTSSNNPSSLSTGLMVGYYGEFSAYANGATDEVRIYNRALGATEVAALYNSGGAKVNTALIGPAASNLVLWHTFDGQKLNSTTSTDSSVSGNNGTLAGGPVSKNGRLGQALSFDGANSVNLKNSLNQSSGSYTFSAWVKPSSFSGCDNAGDGCILVSQNSGVTQGDFWFGFTSQGILTAVFIDSGPTTVARKVDTGGTIAVPGQWYHVLITWNPSGPTYSIYINGVAQPLTTFVTGSGSGGTYIGTELAGNSTYSFRGLIDDVRLYNKAFSASDALALYNLGSTVVNKSTVGSPGTNGLVLWHTFDGNKLNSTTSTDSSSSGNNGTLSGGPVPTRGKIGQALSFDGVGDYINVGDILNFTSSDFTFAYWVYFNSIANGPTILYKGGFNSKGYYAQVSATGQPNFQTNQSGTNQTTLADNGSITTGTWYHIVNVRSGTSVKIYINGVDRTNSAASHINPDSSTDNFQIGRYASDASLDLNGKLDDFRAYNRALSATEILQLYNAGK